MFRAERLLLFAAVTFLCCSLAVGQRSPVPIPETLVPWKDWVMWDAPNFRCPTPYNAADQPICVWPTALDIEAQATGGQWGVDVQVYAESWLPLPGDTDVWPLKVMVNDQPIPVVEKEGHPTIFLSPGQYRIVGTYAWQAMPERIAVPKNYGVVTLSVSDQKIPTPTWDTNGLLWLKRTESTESDQDQLSLAIYRVVEDGQPIWLRTQVEINVAGKSRETDLGYVLPDGWQISSVTSPIPVALDESGRMKVQVRAGTWRIQVDAFRNVDLDALRFTAERPPATTSELIALRAKPELRLVELQGATPVDANMTTFPAEWRDLPIFEWNTSQPLAWSARTEGNAAVQPERFAIERQMWLDDNGTGITYQDHIRGTPRQVSRLDVASNHELSVIRVDGERQLITENPATKAHGIEIRSRAPRIEAIGRVPRDASLAATGWSVDADSLNLIFWLPPGWRMMALFGADRVEGAWLTSWSLLDLFLLLVFTLAVFRLWGFVAGVIAFLAFGLSYHEPGSPRFTWFLLLIPLAILSVSGPGRLRTWLQAWRYLAASMLLLNLIPFLLLQIQTALYPQLEPVGVPYQSRQMLEGLHAVYNLGSRLATSAAQSFDATGATPSMEMPPASPESGDRTGGRANKYANMQFEPGTSIQTGIAKPDWYGNQILCHWNGAVPTSQQIQPVLISATQHRILSVVRMLFLGILAMMLLRSSRKERTAAGNTGRLVRTSVVAVMVLASCNTANAEIPDADMLETLRERLLQPSDAFPQAADLPVAKLTLADNRLTVTAEVHAAVDCAVPVPGQFPVWSPLTVSLNGKPAVVCRRDDGYLWVSVPQGVHTVTAEGLISDSTEWVWSFALVPRRVEIDAPQWNVTGVKEDGQPEAQLFFSRRDEVRAGDSSYDQRHFRSIVLVHRELEIGLVWKVHNTVTRLSMPGKAISLKLPLVPGERVLTDNLIVTDGQVDIQLGAQDQEFRWESELQRVDEITLQAPAQTQTVERWSLKSSPVWNVQRTGLQPIYDANAPDLTPVWHPWPGEQVKLTFQRPAMVAGNTLTVQRVLHNLQLVGQRQRTSHLELQVESSMGGDFIVDLPEATTIRKVMVGSTVLPVRRDGSKCIIPIQPGSQTMQIDWDTDVPISTTVVAPVVTLPTDAANTTTIVTVPESRWVLWASGPTRGPAVRFWSVVIGAIGLAIVLSRLSLSPISLISWILLLIGLTQLHVAAGMVIVAWLFSIEWRQRRQPESTGQFLFNITQVGLVALTVFALGALLVAVRKGLLGGPEMFIVGNGSYQTQLEWFAPTSGPNLVQPTIVSVSIRCYRLFMLLWALWLAHSVLRWLQRGWQAFTQGGAWRHQQRVLQADIVSSEA